MNFAVRYFLHDRSASKVHHFGKIEDESYSWRHQKEVQKRSSKCLVRWPLGYASFFSDLKVKISKLIVIWMLHNHLHIPIAVWKSGNCPLVQIDCQIDDQPEVLVGIFAIHLWNESSHCSGYNTTIFVMYIISGIKWIWNLIPYLSAWSITDSVYHYYRWMLTDQFISVNFKERTKSVCLI